MTTEKKKKVLYVGAARKEFDSFIDLSNNYMDTYCPKWNDPDTPKSYLIPPVFDYKWADISESRIDELKKATVVGKADRNKNSESPPDSTRNRDEKIMTNQRNAKLSDRHGDKAEHIMYRAINRLTDDVALAPFIVVHDLNIDNARRELLRKIFPGSPSPWQQKSQYDFVLIGPKIGLVIIEVKAGGSMCSDQVIDEAPGNETPAPAATATASKPERLTTDESAAAADTSDVKGDDDDDDESAKNQPLIDRNGKLQPFYEKAINQLKNVNANLLLPIEKSMDLRFTTCIKKIIFTPNLKRSCWTNGRNGLTEKAKTKLDEKMGNIIQIFKEDLEEQQGSDRELSVACGKILKNIFCQGIAPSAGDSACKIDLEIYQKFAATFTALSAVTTFSSSSKTITLDADSYSKSLAIVRESVRIIKQMPGKDAKGKQLSLANEFSDLINAKESPNLAAAFAENSKLPVILLTPQQKAVLEKTERYQVIFGPAGTGKTVILQTKALELMRDGESVVIFAMDAARMNYKKIFDENGCSNYHVLDWHSFVDDILQNKIKISPEIDDYTMTAEVRENKLSDYANHFIGSIMREKQMHHNNPLFHFFLNSFAKHHLFFDDFGDIVVNYFHVSAYLFFALLNFYTMISEPRRIVWISMYYRHLSKKFMSSGIITNRFEKIGYEINFINQVMRSSNEVHARIYATEDDDDPQVFVHYYDPYLQLRLKLGSSSVVQSELNWLKPIMAHAVQGIVPEIFQEHFASEREAWDTLLACLTQIFNDVLDPLECPGNIIGCIVSSFPWDPISQWRSREEFEELNKNLITRFPDKIGRLASYRSDTPKWCLPWNLRSDMVIAIPETPITMAKITDVVSLEWPMVIHVMVNPKYSLDKAKDDGNFRHCQYQARTRAITTFVEFIYSFDISDIRSWFHQ